jgi:hypothetical protein
MVFNSSYKNVFSERPPEAPVVSWTETVLVVGEASLFPENLEVGKASYSIRLELQECEPDSSSFTRNRTVMQLAFGLEEKDVTTFTRMLGRKVYLHQQRPSISLDRETLASQLAAAQGYIASLEKKVEYLNNSLHHYVQESRNSSF